MAFETGTATDHEDLFDKLRAFLSAAGPAGAGWTELDYDAGSNSVIFMAPGLSTTEEIHMGFSFEADTGADAFALKGWMFRSYNSGLSHLEQPGHSGVGYHPVWDTSIPYWFMANGQRVIIVTKVSTVYTASYVGKFFTYGTPGEWPQPYFLGMPGASNFRWSLLHGAYRNFYDPGNLGGSKILTVDGTWNFICNFYDVSGVESVTDGTNYIWPYSARMGVNSDAALVRFRELRQNVDDTVPSYPLILCGEVPTADIYGTLDGAFAVPGFSLASEDTVEIDGVDALVVQNVFRTSRWNYAAIKME